MSKAGDDLEKIIAIIEASLSPEADIEQNVFLPVLNSPSKRTRQCDVVIRSGTQARQTVTLIEVQDRASKVSIGTFCDWLEKLKEVGANHLICISRLDFPESVKEKASDEGHRVLLMNLNKLLPESLPLGLVAFQLSYENISIKNIINNQFIVRPGTFNGKKPPRLEKMGDKIWYKNKKDKVSLIDVIEPIIKEHHKGQRGTIKNTMNLSFQKDNRLKLHFLLDGDFVEVGLIIELEYVYDSYFDPLSVSSYEQIKSGALAWVFEIEKKTSQGEVKVKIPVIQSSCGGYQLLDFIYSSDFDSKFELTELNN